MSDRINLSFPCGDVAVRRPSKAELTITARHWLKLAMVTAGHVERDLNQGWELAVGEDFAAMKHSVEMALAALEEAK